MSAAPEQKGNAMNIQIFGTGKSFDNKKAQRWFKERGIRFQNIDLKEKPMSRGEFESVRQAVGGFRPLMDEKSPLYQSLFIEYLSDDQAREEKLLENPGLFRTPIVRNGKKATVGYAPDVWKLWEEEEKK